MKQTKNRKVNWKMVFSPKVNLLYILDWIMFYRSNYDTLIKNGSKIMESQQLIYLSDEKTVILDRISIVDGKIDRINMYYWIKAAAILAALFSISTLLLSILMGKDSETSLILIEKSYWALCVALPLIFLLTFDKNTIRKRLTTYKLYLTDLLNQNPASKTTKNNTSAKETNTPITVSSDIPLGVLFSLFCWKDITTISKAKQVSQIINMAFINKDGKHYKPGTLGTTFGIKTPKKTVWECYKKLLIDIENDIAKYGNCTTVKDENGKINAALNFLFSYLKKTDITFNITDEQLKVLLKIFINKIIFESDELLELTENEIFLLSKVFNKHLKKSSRKEKAIRIIE